MTFVLLLLVGVSLFWVIRIIWRNVQRLDTKLDRLQATVAELERRFEWLSSQTGVAEPSPDEAPEPAAAQTPEPIHAPPTEPPAEATEAAAAALAASQAPPARPAEAHFPVETLEDLELPPEEMETRQPEPAMAAEPAGEPAPSPWAQRWRAFKANVDWELFTGIKLFAWLGGLALFIAAGFFVKYSIDNNLIPPALRLAIGALAGVALIIGAGRFRAERYQVARHTLAAGGIGVLYSVAFAATLYYEYLSKPVGFGLLALISAAAFVLAVRYRSVAISVLGALGAYATPLLVSTGSGSLPLLLAYLAVVNLGLYQVVGRLRSAALLLVATAGTLATLFLATTQLMRATDAMIIAPTWIANLALFSAFLWLFAEDPGQNRWVRGSSLLLYLTTLAVAVLLMLVKPGWAPLLMITFAQAGALVLAWRRRGWYDGCIPFSALNFAAALAWVWLRFEPSGFSVSFILVLFYGAMGGIGLLPLIRRYGIDRAASGWLKIFPTAMVLVSLSVMFRHQGVSFWFWPLLLGLELVGLGISLIMRAFVQVGLLVVMLLVGGLYWLWHMPAELVGMGFFIFIMAAGIALCGAVFLILKKLPQWTAALQLEAQPIAGAPAAGRLVLEPWLAAAPAGGVCVLLAAAFLMPFPMYPHPGLATLLSFLVLVLVAAHRLRFEIPGAAALLAAAAAQAVCVFHPPAGLDVALPALIWAGALFAAALAAPFLFFRAFGSWRRLWHAWALFEALQALFVLYTAHLLWPHTWGRWVPLLLTVLKLPGVAVLLRRLEGRPERNAILAFHGGALLFYLSALPVLALSHGWIGLTFVFEASALLWLNRRITHPGLRWVSLAMAPAGLAILILNLPRLKPVGGPPVLNAAVLAVAACFAVLLWAATQAGYPTKRLGRLNLPAWFQWFAVGTGFFLVNLIIADVFAPPERIFQIWPGRDFLQCVCYGLAWTAMGGLTWRLTNLPRAIRTTGLIVAGLGSIAIILLPLLLPGAISGMRPLFNVGLAAFVPLMAMLYYLFHKEPWDKGGSLIKNLILALFMIAGFVGLKVQSATVFQSGYPFTLFSAHTPSGAAASALGWFAYGLALVIWPRRLDRPFRLAGTGLVLIGVLKALALPFRFKVAFATMTPLLNPPSLVFLLCLVGLTWLTLKPWDPRWPLQEVVAPRVFWGIALALAVFCVLNIEIASVFADRGRPFGMLTHGSLAMQLAYSIGWLIYAIGLLVVGIKWENVQVRWAAIAAIVITAFKIFIRDLWHLGQLYRVGSLAGLAVVLILVSILYQRFLSEGKKDAM